MSIKSGMAKDFSALSLKQDIATCIELKKNDLEVAVATFAKKHRDEDVTMYRQFLFDDRQRSVTSFAARIAQSFLHFTESPHVYQSLVPHMPFKPWPSAGVDAGDTLNHFKGMLEMFISRAANRILGEYASWTSLDDRLDKILLGLLMDLLLKDVVQKVFQQLEIDSELNLFPEQPVETASQERIEAYAQDRIEAYTEMQSVFEESSFLLDTLLPEKATQAFEALTFISGILCIYKTPIRLAAEVHGFRNTIEPWLLFLLKIYRETFTDRKDSIVDIKTRFMGFYNVVQHHVCINGKLSEIPALQIIWAQKQHPEYLEKTVAYFIENPHFNNQSFVNKLLGAAGKLTNDNVEYLKPKSDAIVARTLAQWIKVNGSISKNPFPYPSLVAPRGIEPRLPN